MLVVTGATGHLGNNLVRLLVSEGQRVRALVLPGDDLRSIEEIDVEVVEGDVRDRPSLERAFHGAEAVFHLASVVSLNPEDESLLEAVNVEGTRNVVEVCRKVGVPRLVYVGSIHALPELPPGKVLDEGCFRGPGGLPDPYSRTKARATQLVLEAAEKGLETVAVMPTGIIGPHDYGPSLMGRAILDIARGRFSVTFDGGYDFADVRDVAQGIISAWRLGRSGELYVLSGEWVSVRFLVEAVCRLVGRPTPRVHLPHSLIAGAAWLAEALGYRWVDPRALRILGSKVAVSSAKAKEELGYRCRPAWETLRDTVAWFEEQGWLTVTRLPKARTEDRLASSGAPEWVTLVTLANQVIEAGQAALNAKLRDQGISSAEANVLMFLYTRGDAVIQEEIVSGVEVSKTAVSRVLARLERKGYIRRARHETDRRSRLVFLTEKARREKEKIEDAYREIVEAALAGIPEEKVGGFLGYLRRVAENLKARCEKLR